MDWIELLLFLLLLYEIGRICSTHGHKKYIHSLILVEKYEWRRLLLKTHCGDKRTLTLWKRAEVLSPNNFTTDCQSAWLFWRRAPFWTHVQVLSHISDCYSVSRHWRPLWRQGGFICHVSRFCQVHTHLHVKM